MKKLFLFAFILLSVCAGKVMAQNIQLHYDLGRALYKSLDERPWVTTTVEMFKADKWGSTYLVHPTFRVIRQSCRAYNLSLK